MLYLDHAATMPPRPEVLQAMAPYLTGMFANPSSRHEPGIAARDALEAARARTARLLGVRPGDVIFTSGGSESNNLAIKGIVLAALAAGKRHLVVSPIEHESVLAPADFLARFHGVEVTTLAVDAEGRITTEAVDAAVRADTALVALGHANNEIGTVQDLDALAAAIGGARLHVDAVQSAGWLPLKPHNADSVSIAGHKLGTPRGIGALAVRARLPLEPLIHGGGQERGRRSGTENVAGAVALATALELADAERATLTAQVGASTAAFIAAVVQAVPGAALTGDPLRRLPNVASFTFAGASGEAILIELERRGVLASSGSACAVGSTEPSHVLIACGIPAEVAHTAVRFSFGHSPLPEADATRLAQVVADAVAAVTAP